MVGWIGLMGWGGRCRIYLSERAIERHGPAGGSVEGYAKLFRTSSLRLQQNRGVGYIPLFLVRIDDVTRFSLPGIVESSRGRSPFFVLHF